MDRWHEKDDDGHHTNIIKGKTRRKSKQQIIINCGGLSHTGGGRKFLFETDLRQRGGFIVSSDREQMIIITLRRSIAINVKI